jgi:hypothetical protein
MTILRTPFGVPAPEHLDHEAGHPDVHETVVRLRDAADQMVAFSRTKTLLREAASTLERLDGDSRHLATEIARLTAELARMRTAPRSS